MLVKEWMTANVISITPDVSMMKASRIMKEKVIRRLPVVDEAGRVVGIVTDRDIRDASPSKATTLDMHELYYLLSELKCGDIMTKNPFCAHVDDSVEGVALIMQHKHFGGMPVVRDDNVLCGIITDSDIFKVLVSITGVRIGGAQLAFELPNNTGHIKPILDILRKHQVGVVSILTSQESMDAPTRKVYVRLRRITPEQEKAVVEEMKEAFPLLYVEAAFTGEFAE